MSCDNGGKMSPVLKAIMLLVCSNVFMTFAWYAHLKELNGKPWLMAAMVSWGIALFEYLLQVPANRIGHQELNIGQLKILQEVITLSVFVPFSVFYMKEPLKLDYLWSTLCMMGAVFFVFRSRLIGT
jgi:uncharacterized protein (DUF486 family)